MGAGMSDVAGSNARQLSALAAAGPVVRHLGRVRAAVLLTIIATPPTAAAQPPQAGEVQVVASPAGSGPDEITYEIRAEECRIRWTISRSGINQGIAQHRAECSLPLSKQVELNSRILDAVVIKEPAFRSLFVGSLATFPELSERLALSARRARDWNAARGTPAMSQPLDAYVLNLLSSGVILTEWRRLFEQKHLVFGVSGIEHVAVATAGSLPFFHLLEAEGMKASDRVPFNCLLWFSAMRQP